MRSTLGDAKTRRHHAALSRSSPAIHPIRPRAMFPVAQEFARAKSQAPRVRDDRGASRVSQSYLLAPRLEGAPAGLALGREPRVGRTENSVKTDHRLSLFIMGAEHTRSKQMQLAAALAQGKSVTAWARHKEVPIPTAYRWARNPEIRKAVEACRRRALDRVVGMMVKRATKSVVGIAALADEAESESVRLRAHQSNLTQLMAVSKFSGLEYRMTEIEGYIRERTGNAGHAG
jgi:hypothetical protein